MRPKRIERETQDFLGGGLAGAAGDGEDLRMAAGTRGAGQVFQAALGVADGQQRAR